MNFPTQISGSWFLTNWHILPTPQKSNSIFGFFRLIQPTSITIFDFFYPWQHDTFHLERGGTMSLDFFRIFMLAKLYHPLGHINSRIVKMLSKYLISCLLWLYFNITKFCGKYHHHTSTEEVAEKQHSSFKSRYSSMIFTRFLSCVVCLEMAHMWHKCAKGATNIFEQMKMCCLLSKDKFCMM